MFLLSKHAPPALVEQYSGPCRPRRAGRWGGGCTDRCEACGRVRSGDAPAL